jgi:hypothetical protein
VGVAVALGLAKSDENRPEIIRPPGEENDVEPECADADVEGERTEPADPVELSELARILCGEVSTPVRAFMVALCEEFAVVARTAVSTFSTAGIT